jgi:uncharacterized membrane protein YqhA
MTDDGPQGKPEWEARSAGHLLLWIVASSRLFAVLAVLGTFLSAVTLYVYGILVVCKIIWDTITQSGVDIEGAKELQVAFIELTDVFLLGTVLGIVAFGLYQLFVESSLSVPDWLKIQDLDQLTAKLIEVIGVLLGVTFLAYVVNVAPDTDVLDLGIAVALVIVALSLLLIISHHLRREDNPSSDH